jgi:hypothetical protein
MNALSALTREAWLNEAADFILFDILGPKTGTTGGLADRKIKVSVGFSQGIKSNSRTILGVCYRREVSCEGFAEIFISPVSDDSEGILATLVHELIHALDNCASGHKGFFAKTARECGLEGALTATTAGPWLKNVLAGYIEVLGPIPHAKLTLSKSGIKKQTNRNILVSCGCSFKFRTAQSQIDTVLGAHGHITCPNCGDSMQVEGGEDE